MNMRGLKLSTVLALTMAFALSLNADAQREKKKPDVSQGASVSQTIGIDENITITYHRPGVKGRDVWAKDAGLVEYGGDPRPWRAGANEATTITFSDDVKVEGQDLEAGTYSFFIIPREEGDWTLVLNSQAQQWGSYQYKKEQDVLRVNVSPVEAPHQEWLEYGFQDLAAYSCTAYLHWEEKKVPFEIELADKEME